MVSQEVVSREDRLVGKAGSLGMAKRREDICGGSEMQNYGIWRRRK